MIIARAKVKIRQHGIATLEFKLTRLGVKLLNRRDKLRTKLTITLTSTKHKTTTTAFFVTLSVTPARQERTEHAMNITSSFDGESGVAGFVERIIAPRSLHHPRQGARRIDAYAHAPLVA
jgi:hypothetical protein